MDDKLTDKMRIKLYYTAASIILPLVVYMTGLGGDSCEFIATLILGAFIVFRPKDWGNWES